MVPNVAGFHPEISTQPAPMSATRQSPGGRDSGSLHGELLDPESASLEKCGGWWRFGVKSRDLGTISTGSVGDAWR